jgi:small-conductance mechanosensitive channel
MPVDAPSRPSFSGRSAIAICFAVLAAMPGLAQEAPTLSAPPLDPPPLNRGLGAPPEGIDRTTPRRAWNGFIDAAAAKDFLRAAHYLDLGEVQPDQQPLVGPDRASKLYQLLRALRYPEPSSLPDEPDPVPLPDGKAGVWVLKSFEDKRSDTRGEIRLLRARLQDNQPVWLFGSNTVSSTGAWFRRIVERHADAPPVSALNEGLPAPPPSLDRSTPYRSLKSFIDACRVGDMDTAVHSLYLNDVAPGEQSWQGRRLARMLKMALDQELWLDFGQISDQPHGKPESAEIPADEDEIGAITAGTNVYPIRMLRVPAADDTGIWVFSPGTMSAILPLYRHYGIGSLIDWIPDSLYRRYLDVELWQWAGAALGILVALLGSYVLGWLLLRLARFGTRFSSLSWDRRFEHLIRGPVRALVFLSTLRWWVTHLRPSQPVAATVGQLFFPLLVLAIGWLLLRLAAAGSVLAESYLASGIDDPSLRRSAATRVLILRRVTSFIISLCVAALILMQFELVRSVGTGLLASAGLAGLALGFAAQQTLSNIFAGIQLGITQPVRIGDVVIFEGEYGTIEEMSLTHVVIRVWDLRRLVVPIPYLLAKPIQNWTRVSPELLGTVFIYADYTVDVEAARHAAVSIAKSSPKWDGRVEPSLLVTNLKDSVVELRVMVSAANAGDLWDLRCQVREKMLSWLQHNGSMAHVRLTLDGQRPGTVAMGPAVAVPASLPARPQ